MPRRSPDDPYHAVYRSLADPSRKSPRGAHRYAYTEEQFERRLNDESPLPLHDESLPHAPLDSDALIRHQVEELLHHLGLTDRQAHVCRMRLEGHTALEIAGAMGLSERRVYALLKELRECLEIRLKGCRGREIPGADPYYGWQELFLDSQRR
ncbi:MAG: hypothetical protein KY468_17730 [Armatimonadetes bacterium]|nr:hypothetical protein [Armatimonadota bacterium]